MSDPVFKASCPKCGKPTGQGDYYLNKGRPRGVCKTCWNRRNRTSYRKNRKARIGKVREYKIRLPKQSAAHAKAGRLRLRREVLHAYGGDSPSCKCCGEDTEQFLAVDHVNGGGNAHRRSINPSKKKRKKLITGDSFYRWLKKNGYPPGFQILCHNCNFAKSAHGACPHQARKILNTSLKGMPYMDTRHSGGANALALTKNWDAVCDEADAHLDEEVLDPLAVGFDLAMKLVQKSALAKYAGADLKVCAVTGKGHNATAYFIASGEDEVLARLAPLPK